MMKKPLLSAALALVAFGPLAAYAEPHCQPCPYDCRSLGLGKKDCSDISGRGNACCVDLSGYGLKLAEQQEQALRDANRYSQGAQPSGHVAPAQDRCPSGFRPSEQKCSTEERRRGCKDMRMPSGLGCVKR